ncbi:MAG: U32 family peptidase [Lachnospiraceae bacterium]|nr:U32 family peptidase [Lachnospiraceae bacterium]
MASEIKDKKQSDHISSRREGLLFLPELLSPAGDYETAVGALNAGADAVYLGASAFSARAYAKNLDTEEIAEIIRYAHLFGKKIYLTANILMRNSELKDLLAITDRLYEAGLDGCIIQDLGVLSLFHERYPKMEMHASTQMSVLSAAGVRKLKKYGVTRVVPGRELSLDEVIAIKAEGIQAECFIHGAMCYAYSGRCLMSSLAGGRSGNRGRCAGPCRQFYRCSGGDEGYIISMKDMCSVKAIPALIDAGVDSFKIEGRMKDAAYSAGVTAVYRHVIDDYIKTGKFILSKEDEYSLKTLYIRSEVQDGYYFKHNGKDMISVDSPAYVKVPDELKSSVRDKYLSGKMKIPVRAKITVKKDEDLKLELTSGNICVSKTGDRVNAATARPLSDDVIKDKICMTGATDYEIKELIIDNDGGSFVPMGALKKIRRDAFDELAACAGSGIREARVIETDAEDVPAFIDGISKKAKRDTKEKRSEEMIWYAGISDMAQLSEVLRADQIRSVIVPMDLLTDSSIGVKKATDIRNAGKDLFIRLPDIVRQKDLERIRKKLKNTVECYAPDGVYVDSYDALGLACEFFDKDRIHADMHLYAFNSCSIRELLTEAGSYTVDVESNIHDIREKTQPDKAELITYGFIPVMYSAGCVIKTAKNGCDKNEGKTCISDEKGHRFSVLPVHEYCYNIIYNCVPTSLHTVLDEVGNAGIAKVFRLEFTMESAGDTGRILKYYCGGASGDAPDCLKQYTNGHLFRGAM